VLFGRFNAKRLDRWTAVFLVTTAATSLTSFGFPFDHLLPSHKGDRVQKADVMQSSMIEAWFGYNAATRAEMLPRIPTPAPNAKSHE
jgi:hypothetical protein